jgi:hypothetical protein
MSKATINVGTPVEVSVDNCCDSSIASSELASEQKSYESENWDWTQDVRCGQCSAEGTFYWERPDGPFDGGAYALEGPFKVNVEGAKEREP